VSISLLTPHPYKPSSLYPSNNAPSRLPPHQTHPGVNPIHPDPFFPQQPLRENATFFMLTTNSEADIRGAVQSVSELEHRFNHKYNYPWIFLNDQPFSDEFKSYVLACLSLLTLSPDRSVRKPPLGSHLGTRPLCADSGSRLESASMDQRYQGDRANGVDGQHPESWKYIVRLHPFLPRVQVLITIIGYLGITICADGTPGSDLPSFRSRVDLPVLTSLPSSTIGIHCYKITGTLGASSASFLTNPFHPARLTSSRPESFYHCDFYSDPFTVLRENNKVFGSSLSSLA
jgi:hypothetical protein